MPLAIRSTALRLARNVRAVAMVEFALALPVLVILGCTGLEFANYITTKMRVSQIALQLADNASRMGDPVQGVKVVSEANINEVFVGGDLQAGRLDLDVDGRVILSSLEPVAIPNPTNRFKIRWQRCYGARTDAPRYGAQAATNLTGMGPTSQLVTAQDGDATMFVEVFYHYTPLFAANLAPSRLIVETAAMVVRDPRKLNSLPTTTGTAATC